MANTLKFGSGQWATKVGSTLAFNDEDGNFKPLPFNFTRSTSGTRINKDGLIEVVTNNKPRIDFLNDSNGALLLEPAKTNLVTYSEDFSNAYWDKSAGASVLANQYISPDGTLNAEKINFSSSNQTIGRYFSLTSDIYTLSVYVKGNVGETIRLANLGTESNFTLTGEWQRIELTRPTVTSAGNIVISTYGGATAREIFLWGAQLEQGSYATSYIPTQGAISTKVAESCEQTVPSGIIGQTEGSVYFEVKPTSTLPSYTQRIITLYEDASNLVSFQLGGSNELTFVSVKSGESAVVITKSVPALNLNSFNKIACSISANNFVFYVNGVKVGEDTTVGKSMPSVSNIIFANYNNTNPFLGSVKEIKLYNTALTDAELQALTS